MIPDIGLMVGAYIITRMVALLLRSESHVAAAVILKLLAGVTIAVTAFVMLDLVLTGARNTGLPNIPAIR